MLAKSFALLIHNLAEEHHDGKLMPLAQRASLAVGTVSQWRRGITKQPDPASLHRLCVAYGLDPAKVFTLIMNDISLRADGRPVPMPDVTDVKPGPARQRRRVRLGYAPASRRRHEVLPLAAAAMIEGSTTDIRRAFRSATPLPSPFADVGIPLIGSKEPDEEPGDAREPYRLWPRPARTLRPELVA